MEEHTSSPTTMDGADWDVQRELRLGGGPIDTGRVLGRLWAFLDRDRMTNVGFPSAFDMDFTAVGAFFNRVLNNIGDPWQPSAYPANTSLFERAVVDWFADLLRAPVGDRWGYVTTGGTEGNEYGLWLGRETYPDAVTYYSAAAHYSVPKLLAKLRMPAVCVRAREDGRIDLLDLRHAVRARRDKPAIVVATIGTTMTEAVDDVTVIRDVLAKVPVKQVHIHADAALSGLPLALVAPEDRPGFDLADGADSISVSGHKFLGAPVPCGVVVTRSSAKARIGRAVDYTGSPDTTLGGSRSGHAPLLLWYALASMPVEELRARVVQGRHVAAYAVEQLNGIGWAAWKQPHGFTVVMPTPVEEVARRWRLASSNGSSHLICMPGVTLAQVDELVADLGEARPTMLPRLGAWVPQPRTVVNAAVSGVDA